MPVPGGPRKQDVLALQDEAGGRQFVDQRAVHLLVEIEIEGIERAVCVAEARLLDPPRDQPILSARELVADERGHEIDGRLAFGLGVAEPGVQRRGHAGESELPEGGVEFDEIHERSPVCWSMRSR